MEENKKKALGAALSQIEKTIRQRIGHAFRRLHYNT